MKKFTTALKNGVKEIISHFNPPQYEAESKFFQSSTHQHREICLVLHGSSRYMLNGSVYDATPGTVFLIDRWIPHAFGYSPEDKGIIHFWLYMRETDLHGTVITVKEDGNFSFPGQTLHFSPGYLAILDKRWTALRHNSDISENTVMEYMAGVLNAIYEDAAFQINHKKENEEKNIDSVMEALKEYMLTTNARDSSLARLEELSGYNRYYLSHRFREYETCTIGKYINKIRMEYTKNALKQGMKQKEIAFELGFSSPSNFWNWLKKHNLTQE